LLKAKKSSFGIGLIIFFGNGGNMYFGGGGLGIWLGEVGMNGAGNSLLGLFKYF
jgi:hypothetical protein